MTTAFEEQTTPDLLNLASGLEQAVLTTVNRKVAGVEVDGYEIVHFHMRFRMLGQIADVLHDRGVVLDSALV